MTNISFDRQVLLDKWTTCPKCKAFRSERRIVDSHSLEGLSVALTPHISVFEVCPACANELK